MSSKDKKRVVDRFNLERWLTQDTALSCVLVIVLLFIIVRILPTSVDNNLSMSVHKNKVAIEHLNQPRNLEFSKTVFLDKLDLSRDNRFAHPELGDIGFSENFFADVETEFEILQRGDYRFLVASDDGFALEINGEELCRFTRNRPIRSQVCRVRLEEGKHKFKLRYYQGVGHAGLKVQYRRQGDADLHWFGEDSEYLEIIASER